MRVPGNAFRSVVLLTAVVFGAFAAVVLAAELPQGFRLEPVVGGLTEPSALAATPEGEILIAERTTGNLRVVRLGELQAAPLCSVSVNSTGEGGLLGVAVHPSYSSNGWVYLYYTDSATNKNKVRRFTIAGAGSTCAPGPDILPDLGAGVGFLRNGGGLGFGSDGKLYVATGDMESSANGQDPGTLQGKILRVNDDGGIPGDNPPPGSRVYTRGVRDGRALVVGSGQVYATDRGSTPDVSYDELNAAPSGGSLGWDVQSGPGSSPHTSPLVSWASPGVEIAGVSLVATGAFPDLDGNSVDDDLDRFGPNRWPAKARLDDNFGIGECVGSTNNGLPCTVANQATDCPPRPSEPAYCESRDELAEWCPGGTPVFDDDCDNLGPAGTDEPDENYLGNVFAAAGTKIQRAVLATGAPSTLSTWRTFFDTTALPDCPTAWTGVAAGADGWLYALARNGGGPAGALYRIIHESQPGPREVSGPTGHFPLRVEKGATDAEVLVYWEDLRDDALQNRDDGVNPLPPLRQYTIWRGTIGSWYSHAAVAGLDAVAGTEVNGALRREVVPVASSGDYFLVSARHANIEGTLGQAALGEVPGYPVTELCPVPGYHDSPSWSQFRCARTFTLGTEHWGTLGLAGLRAHPVVMDFGAIWCGPCHFEADNLEPIYQEYKDRGVHFLTVLMDEEAFGVEWSGRPTKAECRNWSDRPSPALDHTFECVNDPVTCPDPAGNCSYSHTTGREAWPKYNAHLAWPTTVVIDQGGRVVYTVAGWGGPAGNTVADRIRLRLNALVGTTDSCLH